MSEPRWVPLTAIRIIHDRQIARHGGLAGLRDAGLLESACARPLNQWHYGGAGARPDMANLAAACACGISRAHAFVDGNKRTAFQAAFVFLHLNGLDLHVGQNEVVDNMNALAKGAMPEADFARWLGAGCRRL